MEIKSLLVACALVLPVVLLNPVVAAQTSGVTANISTPAEKTQKLSINKATLDQLVAVPGIGQAKAEAILAYIQTQGPIKNQQQLTEVKGIGEKLAAKIAQYISF